MAQTKALPISTNDLLRHAEVRVQLHGNEVAWVRSVSGPPEEPILTAGLGMVTLFGPIDVVRERLAALVNVIDTAIARPDLWPQIGLRQVHERRRTRDHPHPFVALGSSPAGPQTSSTTGAESANVVDNG